MPATCESAGAASRMRSPTSVWRRTNFHSSSVSGPGFSRISSGIAILPMSCSDAASRVRTTSPCDRPNRSASDSASSATPATRSPSPGLRSASAVRSTPVDCSPGVAPRPFFCVYMRWSARRRASIADVASAGRITAPYADVIEKPSPCSTSAFRAPWIIRS